MKIQRENHGIMGRFSWLFNSIGREQVLPAVDGEEMGLGMTTDTFFSSLLTVLLRAHPTIKTGIVYEEKMNTSRYVFILQ